MCCLDKELGNTTASSPPQLMPNIYRALMKIASAYSCAMSSNPPSPRYPRYKAFESVCDIHTKEPHFIGLAYLFMHLMHIIFFRHKRWNPTSVQLPTAIRLTTASTLLWSVFNISGIPFLILPRGFPLKCTQFF